MGIEKQPASIRLAEAFSGLRGILLMRGSDDRLPSRADRAYQKSDPENMKMVVYRILHGK